ncbi:MAG: hypothetical protein WA761_02465 [Thermoplasmata archaeon]
MKELQEAPVSVSLSTAELTKRITRSKGKEYHKNSIYNALRSLVRRGELSETRRGHEKAYQLRKSGRFGQGRPPRAMTPPDMSERTTTNAIPLPQEQSDGIGMLPHKLALGEILVLSAKDGEVVTATNLHGRLVLERHPLPERA